MSLHVDDDDVDVSAVGSFILAFIKALRWAIQTGKRNAGNDIVRCLLDCFLGCIEGMVQVRTHPHTSHPHRHGHAGHRHKQHHECKIDQLQSAACTCGCGGGYGYMDIWMCVVRVFSTCVVLQSICLHQCVS